MLSTVQEVEAGGVQQSCSLDGQEQPPPPPTYFTVSTVLIVNSEAGEK
ncbi:MAG: hypothetical protein LBP53_07195 [Candidatus Peribacteria bacterium]|nr:hypothetical protein [Candidatus Peribacteria bacterium]